MSISTFDRRVPPTSNWMKSTSSCGLSIYKVSCSWKTISVFGRVIVSSRVGLLISFMCFLSRASRRFGVLCMILICISCRLTQGFLGSHAIGLRDDVRPVMSLLKAGLAEV